MDGKRGVATDFHAKDTINGDRTTWRYTVKLNGGEAFKFKLANVRAGGGAGKAKKGKGKKARSGGN